MAKRFIRRSTNTGYKGMAKISRSVKPLSGQQTKEQPRMNLLIGDNYFKQNPDHVLGEQSVRRGRFGDDLIVVKGTLAAALEKIEAKPVAIVDLLPEQVPTTETRQEVIEQVFRTEEKAATEKKVKDRRRKQKLPSGDAEVFSFSEIDELYNKGISRDEKEAYYFTHPELNYKLLFDRFTNGQDELLQKKLICWEPAEKKFVYYITWQAGNIGKKISNMQREKENFIRSFGQKQYDLQMQMLEAVKPKAKGFTGDERIVLLPHSNFAKGFFVTELRYNPLPGEMDLARAFVTWLKSLTPDNFKKTTSREIIDYYMLNKSYSINKTNKEQQAKDEKNAINTNQRTKEEGDELFARFLADELTPDDQARLQFLWNEKFNSYVEPDLTKIPVCFQMSKRFKKGPLMLNPTQRQAAAFQTEKFSALLAYGVGVGKTLASIICFSQAYYNGYCKKGCFVVPTNTYDKWLGEIQGYTDKETGEFMHGALPQLPAVVGLFNLNPEIVQEKLKTYSAKDEAVLTSITNAIETLKKNKGTEISDGLQKAISAIYPINWPGVFQQYNVYRGTTKASNPKSRTDFVIDYLKEEYNYYVYELGTVKSFPEGTIFVVTEVGLQRLGISDVNKGELVSKLFFILSQGERAADRQSNRDIAGLQIRVEQTVSSSLKKAKLLVEDLGLDWVCFDEAHYYKKVFTFVKGDIIETTTDRKTGEKKVKREKSKYELKSGQYPSARALSAFVLSHYIQSKNSNRNVIQLTATPFTNSPLEVYSMLTLTNFQALQELGLANMTDFFDTFMKINYDIKYTAQKTVVKDVVLKGYNNLPQLRGIIYSLMDKKDEGASPRRPEKIIYPSVEKAIETTLPMTTEQNELMSEVKKYIKGDLEYEEVCSLALAEELENMDFDGYSDDALIEEWERITQAEYEGERENLTEAKRQTLISRIKSAKVSGMAFAAGDLSEEESAGVRILKALSMMRQITLSPYLYHRACRKAAGAGPYLPNYLDYINSSPKLKYTMGCIASALNWHKKAGTKPGGHVIYMNAGVDYFPLIKEYLVKQMGLRDSQVGMVTGQMSRGAKENAKQAFLRGDMLVLIGSSTISVGVDLQNNATTLYNLYYDWNPTDAQQIEGRIWRQGNRFAYVRIVYPQCYNSADPVIFEYLSQKTLRINEIWNRSSEVQELDLRDFNPKELQKKLITDPEEKADWDILEQTDKIESEIIFAENRRESLQNAMYAFRAVNELRPKVISWLDLLSAKKLALAREKAITEQQKKISDLTEKYSDDPEKMADEITKYKKGRYDHRADPEGRYTPIDYSTGGDQKVYTDAKKYLDLVSDWTYQDSNWGDLYYQRDTIEEDLKRFRTEYRDMQAASERILKPLGLSFENMANPIADFDRKIVELRDQLDQIAASRPQRVEQYRQEAKATKHQIKTVQERIDEFAADNEKYLAPQLIITALTEPMVPAKKEAIIVPKSEQKLKQREKRAEPEKAPAGKTGIERQIKALQIAIKFAPEPEKINKQIKALETALKFAA